MDFSSLEKSWRFNFILKYPRGSENSPRARSSKVRMGTTKWPASGGVLFFSKLSETADETLVHHFIELASHTRGRR